MIEKDIQDFQKSIKNQINDSVINIERDFELFKSTTINLLHLCNDKESFEKSWSSDLQKQFPEGSWRTINGASVFINHGRVVAGLDKFNGMIDDFFAKKESGEKEGRKEKEIIDLDFLTKNREEIISKIKDTFGDNESKLKRVMSYIKDSVVNLGDKYYSIDEMIETIDEEAGDSFREDEEDYNRRTKKEIRSMANKMAIAHDNKVYNHLKKIWE